MTNEEKKLLLKDLCARLPYFVYVQIEGKTEPEPLNSFMDDDGFWFQLYDENGIGEGFDVEQIKPYLRQMSSMTEEEYEDFRKTFKWFEQFDENLFEWTYESYDWLNAHHFDYRGLIKKGLALEATDDVYKK